MNFRHLSVRQAEEELVGACLDHESALRIALDRLPVDDFRSHVAYDLRRVFYVLAGWLERGAYGSSDAAGGEERRERLLPLFRDRDEGEGYVDMLWCPWGIVPAYVEALCDAIKESNRLQDEAVESARKWRSENPLSIYLNEEVIKQPVPPPVDLEAMHARRKK